MCIWAWGTYNVELGWTWISGGDYKRERNRMFNQDPFSYSPGNGARK